MPDEPYGLGAFETGLDLKRERRELRRTETWILIRGLLILLVVIAAVVARSIVL